MEPNFYPDIGRLQDLLGLLILGKTKLPRTIASRSIILKMWPKKPDEKAEDFAYADDPEFSTIGASSHGGLPTTSVSSRT